MAQARTSHEKLRRSVTFGAVISSQGTPPQAGLTGPGRGHRVNSRQTETSNQVRMHGATPRVKDSCCWRLGLPLVLVLACSLVLPLRANDRTVRQRGAHPAIGDGGIDRPVIGIDSQTRRMIDRALDYLYRHQNPDGSWTDIVGRKVHNSYWGTAAPHVGVTGLAGIAFLAGGTLPGQGVRGDYCTAVRKALDFVIRQTEANGFIAANGSRMYSHAFATLFLAEALGTGFFPDDQRLQETLKRSVRLIVRAQNEEGGWRYLPNAIDSDMSVTVCQVFALRAARNAGIKVPRETIDRAIDYVKESFDADEGGFKYQIDRRFRGARSRHSFALTACGVATLYGAGEYDAQEIRRGLQYLWDRRPQPHLASRRFDFFYAHYYAVQAAYQAGGAYWTRWYEDVKNQLRKTQQSDGSWKDLVGPCYGTAMAAIILQMPNQYLPITES